MKIQFTILFGSLSLVSSLVAQDTSEKEAQVPSQAVEGFNENQPLSEEMKKSLQAIGSSEEKFRAVVKARVERSKKFRSLDQKIQDEFTSHLMNASKLAGEMRVAESLYSALQALDLFAEATEVYNLLGSSYIELRDMEKAVKNFEKSAEFEPYNAAVQFNLAEAYFVSHNYQKSLEMFTYVAKLSTLNPTFARMADLVQFKIELSHLGISNDASLDADLRAKHRKIFDDFVNPRDYRNHSLLTYYSKAAQQFASLKPEEAVRWIENSRYVFSNESEHTPWFDTMLEFGFVTSGFNKNVFDKDLAPKEPQLNP
jgi:tetratricopeptide (TPR) repeat protein